MDKLKPHPFEAEVDSVLTDLQVDLSGAKRQFSSGIMYDFVFGETSAYLALPVFVPTRSDNVVRAEFLICLLREMDVVQRLHAVSLDLDMHIHFPIRAISRSVNRIESKVILQFVSPVSGLQPGFLADVVRHGVELADRYRSF